MGKFNVKIIQAYSGRISHIQELFSHIPDPVLL